MPFGTVRLAMPVKGSRLTVGLIASDEPGNVNVAEEAAKTGELFRAYASQAERLAVRGAQVIVIPEKLGVMVDPDTKSIDEIFEKLADITGETIVAGMVHVSPPVKYNEARVYAPEAPVLSYDKHHMLPPFESKLKPGTTPTLMQKDSATWGVEICKDMDFTPLSREYGRKGAGLMLETSNCHKLLRAKNSLVVNVMVKRRDLITSCRDWRDERERTSEIKHRKPLDVTKIGLSLLAREKHGGSLLTGHAVTGA